MITNAMKKIILLLSFPLLSFSQEKTIESFFLQYNYNCENYNGEDLYEFFGFDIEDDVTPALEAINSFCENGSEPNKNEAFIIATNVNVRNLPSLEKGVGEKLFKINKTIPGSMQPDGGRQEQEWIWFKPTKVSIIDSVIMDNNLWYKVVGNKLSNEELNNLKSWSDWNIVMDSLYNFKPDNDKIRKNHSQAKQKLLGRWIHHSLVHRFPEDSFSNRVRFYNGKYKAQKSKEDWTGDEVSVEFEVINGRVEGKYRYQPGQYDGESCKFSGFIESNSKIEGQYLCFVEGRLSDRGELNIRNMDNNAFEIFANSYENSSVLTRMGTQYFRYKFEKPKIYEDADKYKGTVFRPGQYKVFLKEIDEYNAVCCPDNFNTYEITLNISDQINGFISARSWGYHGLEGKFLDAKIKNKNTIEFTLSYSDEGFDYKAPNYTIEILDDKTLKYTSDGRYFYFNSDKGRNELVFNYTFTPKPSSEK